MSYRTLLGQLAVVALLLGPRGGHAQSNDARRDAPAVEPTTTGEGETLKERLSDKASDEQRVDNCKVPPDRRGAKPRPDACASDQADARPKHP